MELILKNKVGFTIIELLVVLAVMGLLMGIVLANSLSARSLARDNQRVSDIGVIRNALGRYFVDYDSFPATLSSLVPTYLRALPVDPRTNTSYIYAGITTLGSAASCELYHLGAVVENTGSVGLSQDSDVATVGTVCTGSASDFHGNAAGCSGSSGVSPDPCFDATP